MLDTHVSMRFYFIQCITISLNCLNFISHQAGPMSSECVLTILVCVCVPIHLCVHLCICICTCVCECGTVKSWHICRAEVINIPLLGNLSNNVILSFAINYYIYTIGCSYRLLFLLLVIYILLLLGVFGKSRNTMKVETKRE